MNLQPQFSSVSSLFVRFRPVQITSYLTDFVSGWFASYLLHK